MSEASGIGCEVNSSDAIDRFLDRSWLLEQTPVDAISRHRIALNNLDFWMQRHRVVPLTAATAKDVRALLDSSHWEAVSYGCDSLLSLVASFFQSLQNTRFRNDDPIVTIIDQEISAAAKRASRRPEKRRPRMDFRLSPVT